MERKIFPDKKNWKFIARLHTLKSMYSREVLGRRIMIPVTILDLPEGVKSLRN